MAKCSSCGAEIVWAVTEAGRPMPVDALPAANGNLVFVEGNVVEYVAAGAGTHVSHFATCVNAKQHLKSPRKGA